MQASRRYRSKAFSSGALFGATLLLSLIVLLAAVVPAALAAPSRQSYVVVLNDDVAHPANVAHRHEANRGARITHIYGVAIKGYSADLTPGALKAIRKDPNVDYVESDGVIRPKGQVVGNQLKRVYAAQNPQLDIDGADDARVNVDIAILDTGVYSHPDLNVVSRVNCVEGGGGCKAGAVSDDLSGHGTHVAGDAAAIDNGIGVVGTAPGARIWSVKVINQMGHIGTDEVGMSLEGLNDPGADLKNGNAMMSDAIAGINYVTAHSSEIEVANMSFACATEEWGCARTALAEAIATSVNNGVVWVAAAGQEGLGVANNLYGIRHYPALLSDVITVSAMADYDGLPGSLSNSNGCSLEKGSQHDDRLMGDGGDGGGLGSNYGPEVDMTAPGSCVLSTWSPWACCMNPYGVPVANPAGTPTGSEYGVMYGSSVASALVAGAAADIAAQHNPNNRADVENIRAALLGAGNYNWEDLVPNGDGGALVSPDGFKEPLLSLDGIPSVPSLTPPWVSIGTPYEITDTTATIPGSVSPRGKTTTYQLECGVVGSGYTIKSPATTLPAGTSAVPVWIPVGGLVPGTSYHCRLFASNSDGTTYSTDTVFRTILPRPHVYFTGNVDGKLHELYRKTLAGWSESGDLTVPAATGTSPSSFLNSNKLPRTYFVSSVDSKIHEIAYNENRGFAETAALTGLVAPNTSPSAFAMPNGGVRVYYVGKEDEKIHELSYNSSEGKFTDSGALPGTTKVTPKTSPSAFLNSNGLPRIYYVSAESGNKIRELSYTPIGTWADGGPLSAEVAPETSPSAFAWPGGSVRVYYVRNSDKKVYEVSYTTLGTWADNGPLSSTKVTPKTSPSAFLNSNGLPRIYYVSEGTESRIREISYTSEGKWADNGPLSAPVAPESSPSAFAWPGGGVRFYFARNSDKAIHEVAYTTTGEWKETGALTKPVATATSPSALIWPGGGVRVYFEGAERSIHQLAYDATPIDGWSESTLPASVKVLAGTSPTSFINSNNSPRAYYVGEDKKIYELGYNGGAWSPSGPLTEAVVAPGTSPSAFAWPNGAVRLYFVGTENKIYELSFNNGAWAVGSALTRPVAVGTNPSAVLNWAGQPRIYYVAEEDRKIHELSYTNIGTWADGGALTKTKAMSFSSPSAFINSNGQPRIYFASAEDSNKLHELSYNSKGEWNESGALGGALATPLAPGTSPSAFAWPGGGVRAYFTGADSRVREVLYNSKGEWVQNGPISAPVVSNTSPSAFAWFASGVRVYVISADKRLHELSYTPATGWKESDDLSGSAAVTGRMNPSSFLLFE